MGNIIKGMERREKMYISVKRVQHLNEKSKFRFVIVHKITN